MSPTLRVGRSRGPEPKRPRPRARLTIEELAERTGLTVRTIRSYQTQGILAPPEHRGRIAYYDDSHLERLALVSELKDDGVTLSGIQEAIRRKEAGRQLLPEPSSQAGPPAPPSPTGATRLEEAASNPAHRPVANATPTAGGQPVPTPDRRRTVSLAAVVLSSVILVALVAGLVVLLLRDAAHDRAQLARQISGLRQEISRLAREQGTPTTVVVPAGSPPTTAAPPAPAVAAPADREPSTTTRVITVPAPSPPPTVVVTPPPPPQPTCTTLLILNRCL